MGFSLKTVLLRLGQGFIIGAGGILPGISGGVLSVIFGIYRPVMEVLAHPLNGLRRHLSLLLPVGAGAILGFLCGGGLILVLFDRSEKLATCLFIGLILGTLPSLCADDPWAGPGVRPRACGPRRARRGADAARTFPARPAFLPSPLFCSTRSTARSTRCARASSAFFSAACSGA